MKEGVYDYFYALVNDCEFEDSMTNDAIEFLSKLQKENPDECTDLIHFVYKQYANDLKFLGKLCRCLCYIDIDDEPISDVAYSVLKACVESDDAYCQEGAIMLCEEWGEVFCLSLLTLHLKPCNDMIKQYTHDVMSELWVEHKLN